MVLVPIRDKESVVPFFIDGKQYTPTGDDNTIFPVISSTTEKPVHYALSASVEDAATVCASAGKAFQSWKRSTPMQRRDIIEKVAQIYKRDTEEFIRLQHVETSSTESWARFGIMTTMNNLREIAAQGSRIAGTIPPSEKPGAMSFVFREPVGPVLCIPPWNAALTLATRGIASAIAAGCSVVLKCSELCPATHMKIAEAFAEAGLPPGVLNCIQVDRKDAPKITEALIADRNIKKVEFIGSAPVGKIIGATAAKYLKPILMELGGKCPAIVLDDADLEQAAQLCTQGAIMHHGQICFSTERVLVHANAADRFKEILSAAFKNANIPGNTAVTRSIAQHAVDVMKDAKDHGVEFLVGGDYDFESQVPSLKPSIVLEPKREARIFDEETFGPSVSLCENTMELLGSAQS